jgi:hypothetical protein
VILQIYQCQQYLKNKFALFFFFLLSSHKTSHRPLVGTCVFFLPGVFTPPGLGMARLISQNIRTF